MQQPFRDQLEKYLSGMDDQEREAWEAELFSTLRPPEPIEPSPGFYARVRDRIENQRPMSVWDVFLQPMFARRLAYVSMALALVLGVLTISAEMQSEVFATSPEAILSERPVARDLGIDQQRDRNVVLVNLATYKGY